MSVVENTGQDGHVEKRRREAILDLGRPKLYPKQEAAIFDPRRISIVEASTKSGKTAGCIAWLAEMAMGGKPVRNVQAKMAVSLFGGARPFWTSIGLRSTRSRKLRARSTKAYATTLKPWSR
jgi:hypothetical protein